MIESQRGLFWINQVTKQQGDIYIAFHCNFYLEYISILDLIMEVDLIITASKPLSVLLGDYIALNCSPIFPTREELSYTWTHLNTSTVLQETSNILRFPRISMEELGTYRCSVSPTDVAEVTITSASKAAFAMTM